MNDRSAPKGAPESSATTTTSMVAEMFALDREPAFFEDSRWCLRPGYTADLVSRLQELINELAGFSRHRDIRAYVIAIHALTLELAASTGAPVNGRSHPAFRAFLEDRAAWWQVVGS